LFNPKTQQMLPLGVVGHSGRASFEVPDSLVGRNQIVDVSLERDDGDPGHSATRPLGHSATRPLGHFGVAGDVRLSRPSTTRADRVRTNKTP
jgi:hypothetical protein